MTTGKIKRKYPPTDRPLTRADSWNVYKGDRLRRVDDGSLVTVVTTSCFDGRDCIYVIDWKHREVESRMGAFIFHQAGPKR